MGITRLAMGAALVVALSLTLVFALLLLLLADFFHSLLRRRHCHLPQQHPHGVTETLGEDPPTPLSKHLLPFYAQGVLQAPTSLLLTNPKLEAAAAKPVECETNSDVCSHFVRISNPIYDGVCTGVGDGGGTPFETPDTSPSHFDMEEDLEEERECSPPLKLMKKLPPARSKASSAGFWMDGRRSLGVSVSATDTNRASTSSSSNSLCSSPSW